MPTKAYSMGTVQIAPLIVELKALEQKTSSDQDIIFLAAWALVVSRVSVQETVKISVHAKGNMVQDHNALPMHVELFGEPTPLELIDRVNRALSHAKLSNSGNGQGSTSTQANPLPFQAGFYVHESSFDMPTTDQNLARCDLELHLFEDKRNLTMVIHSSCELYYEGVAERVVGYYQAALTNMITKSTQPIDSFDILSPEEKQLLLERWNQTDTEYPSDRCIHHMFEDQVAKTPEAIAIVHNEQEVTYSELNELAARLASRFVKAGVKRGGSVAILMERSIGLIVTQLAALKIGAAYVVIDGRAPLERQAFILKDSGASLLITDVEAEVNSMHDISLYRLSRCYFRERSEIYMGVGIFTGFQ
ncbi:hypothetical protein BGW42_000862 [Actinomortierella wolfii]|nr:hypothetical protein BGW42_000862 [Actinomortierella wolfii]